MQRRLMDVAGTVCYVLAVALIVLVLVSTGIGCFCSWALEDGNWPTVQGVGW